ncbi:MAG: hypothetical protein OHK0013_42570 [Sandaracinaceae bacterium]
MTTQGEAPRDTSSAAVPAEDAHAEALRSEALRDQVFNVAAHTAMAGLYGAAFLLPVLPVVGAVCAGAAVVGVGVVALTTQAPLRVAREVAASRALRKKAFVEGAVHPIAEVASPDGACCAFELVVRRCGACDCVRPCGRGGRFRWEERLAGRFLVRGEDRVVFVDGADVRFETPLREKASSRFHRLDAGERVRIHGDFEDATELPDDVRALLASHRALPRVLTPRPNTAVLVAKLP